MDRNRKRHIACQQSSMTRIRAHPRIHDMTHVRRLNAHTSAHGACARAAPLRMTNVDCLCWASSNKLRAEAHTEHKPVVAILSASCRRSPVRRRRVQKEVSHLCCGHSAASPVSSAIVRTPAVHSCCPSSNYVSNITHCETANLGNCSHHDSGHAPSLADGMTHPSRVRQP